MITSRIEDKRKLKAPGSVASLAMNQCHHCAEDHHSPRSHQDSTTAAIAAPTATCDQNSMQTVFGVQPGSPRRRRSKCSITRTSVTEQDNEINYYNPMKMFGSVFEDGASLLSEVKCIICRSDCKERGQCHPGASTDRFGRRHRGRPESPVVSSGEVYQQRPTGIASGSRGSGNNRKWCEEQVSWSHTSCRRREGSGGTINSTLNGWCCWY